MVSSVGKILKKAPNTIVLTSDLLIVSDVVYVRYLVLVFFKVNGKRTTDLFDAWLQLRRSSESPLREVLQQFLTCSYCRF